MKFTILSPAILILAASCLMAQEDPEADQYFPLHGDYAASHILISYKGADRAAKTVTRSKKEANAFAKDLAIQLAADPSLFEELARSNSDGPTAAIGGNLRTFPKGRMAKPFEEALNKLADGQIAQQPVKTPFGYHLIRRNPMSAKYFAALALIITHEEAARIKGISNEDAWTRKKSEARVEIDTLLANLKGSDFETMVSQHGDLKTKMGFMGVFKPGDSPLNDNLIDALSNIKYGELSPVIDLPIGFAILQRLKVEKRAGSRILISWQGAEDAKQEVTRSKQEAQTLAQDLSQQLTQNPQKFEELAKAWSTGPFAVRNGKLPNWFKGYQHPKVERALNDLAPGAITPTPIETEEGFVIFRSEALVQ